MALENSTHPRNLRNGSITHGWTLGVMGRNGLTPDFRDGAARSKGLPVFGHLRDRERTHRVPLESPHPRREDRAVLETQSSGEALIPRRSAADG
jgi:hypothetical protein